MKKHISALLWITSTWIALTGLPAAARRLPAPADSCLTPATPVIDGSARVICRGDSVTLRATGCAGTVVWSTGQAGPQIGVQPQQTTRYTAICRAPQGCVSCYAEVWTVVVQTPDPPVLTLSAGLICAGDALTITAATTGGTVVWPDGSTGPRYVDYPEATTTYTAYAQGLTCRSSPARPVSVQITPPTRPSLRADDSELCPGQTTRLWATGCAGTLRWHDGQTGSSRLVRPLQTTRYSAVCQIGSCRSDSSHALTVAVRPDPQPLSAATTLQNDCPFQTVNLARALLDAPGGYAPAGTVAFRTGPLLTDPAVQSVGAVLAGTYYVFQHAPNGCVRGPVAVAVRIVPCRNGVAPCQSDPPGVSIRLDSLAQRAGVVRLTGQLRGSATVAHWQTDGTGLFTDSTLTTARYVASEQDRQRGTVTFGLTTPDPDAAGPCSGQTARLSVRLSAPDPAPVAWLGLSKEALEPVWITNETLSLTYRLTAKNMGQLPLQAVQIADNLTPVLLAGGARIMAVAVRADSGWAINPAYTGTGADTTLLLPGAGKLTAGEEKHVWLTITANVGGANTLTFDNSAFAEARTVAGETLRDQSASGTDADPDRNGDPTDNSMPTTLTVPPAPVAEAGTVFIPEGFSPNGDGINDRFVIRGIPDGQTLWLTVYNRWGQAVFQQTAYANDWDGTTGSGNARQAVPDGTYFYVARLSNGREFARFMTISR
jgi:gliding motility-associated-like protein